MGHGGPAEGFRRDLIQAGLLVDTGVEGVYGRSETYHELVEAVASFISREAVDRPAERLFFPPVLARWVFDRTDYMRSFPDLIGSVHTFRGGDREHARLVGGWEAGGDWSGMLTPAEVVLCPAACHPLYPQCSGVLPEGGRRFEVRGYCFRCEPSLDPVRMQAFQMQEYVYVGEPEEAQAHRDRGLGRAEEMLAALGLAVSKVAANDPFFGRAGKLLAANQLEEALKIEIVTPVSERERPTAVFSANCARDHFGGPFGIQLAGGGVAHSACVAYGVDRIALALVARHGLEPGSWPAGVRAQLWT